MTFAERKLIHFEGLIEAYEQQGDESIPIWQIKKILEMKNELGDKE